MFSSSVKKYRVCLPSSSEPLGQHMQGSGFTHKKRKAGYREGKRMDDIRMLTGFSG